MDVMDFTENQTENMQTANQTVIQPNQSKVKMPINIENYARKDGENIFDYIDRVGQDQIDQYNANVDRYAIKLRPEEYAGINDLINVSSDPAEKEAEGYRIAAAMKYSKLYDIPLDEAYENLDAFNYAIFGNEKQTYTKDFWTSLVDSLTLGQNTVDMGMIGAQIREATERGDSERAAELTALYQKYKSQNELLSKNLPQNLLMKIVESGAQSLPFTMGAIGMSVISPVTGFTYSAGVMAGQEYMDLIEEGASHDTAQGVSTVVGVINGIVEIELGNVAGALGAKASGSKAGEVLRRNVIDKITKNVAEKMHYSGGWRIVADILGRNVLENLEEGAEEAVQETFSLLGKYIANELDDLGIEGMTAKEIADDLAQNFMGGVYGSILLGSGTLAVNSIAAKADYDAIKTAAEIIPSEKSFSKAVENSPVFEEMNEETKAQAIHEIYQKFGSKRDADLQKKAESLSEVISADEGMEVYEAETDEDGNEIEAPEVPAETRDDNGRLYSQQEELTENEDGTYSGRKVYGDATKVNQNQYGYISYTVNEEAGTVTIDDFKTNKYRQYLNNEMFADFASDFADYNIEWNAKLEDAKKWKADIEALNPRGKENGLNYFSNKNLNEAEKKDQQTRQRLVRELGKNFNVNGSEKALAVAMIEAMAKSQGKSVSAWVNDNFMESGIMGNIADLQEAARQESIKQGKEIKATGGMTLIDTVKGVKAIIYAAEGADFSTALHEFSHVWTKGLTGDLLKEAADVFGATLNKDGTYNWDAPVTLSNGKTVSAYENLAYSYEKWLETGKAPTPQQDNIFRKFAEFMKNCIKTLRSAVKLTPDTENFFNKYFNVSEGMLKNAENAVIEETENLTKSGENLTESENVSEEEKEALLNGYNNEELQTLVDAGLISEETAQAVKETNLDPVTKGAVASILDDPNIPAEKKVNAVMKANGEAYVMKQENIEYYRNRADLTEEERAQAVKDLEENNDTDRAGTGIPMSLLESGKSMLFQIIGEKGAQALDEANEETIRMDNKAIAEEMEKAGKDARTIRFATGWERGADGQWKYEISDIKIKSNPVFETDEGDYKLAKLSDVIDADEIFNAYPQLKDTVLQIQKLPLGLQGNYTEQDEMFPNGIITISNSNLRQENPEFTRLYENFKNTNPDWKEYERKEAQYDNDEISASDFLEWEKNTWRNTEGYKYYNDLLMGRIVPRMIEGLTGESTIAHEIQHAIQHIEGFATGGSPESLTAKAYNSLIDDLAPIYAEIGSDETLQSKIKAYKKANLELDFSRDDILDQMREAESIKDNDPKLTELWNKLQDISKKYNFVNHAEIEPLFDFRITDIESSNAKEALWRAKRLISERSKEDYRNLAGEVESRNVQDRLGLTVEERRRQLLEDTEDVARDEQIVLFQEAELDKEYEEAVNSGNTEKAIQMLKQKAEANGYFKADYFGNGSWAAPTAVVDNAEDFSNLDALQEYIDDYGGEVNVYGIINGIQGHDENYYFDPSRAGFHGQAASDTAQVYRKLRYDKAGPDTEVTVYRAVPNDINGEKLMRGDWIALSKNYCEEHGKGRYGEGNFHIIEEKVAIKNIWQGEEDMREFGFDDGKSDIEKNVSNNRKLLEITYDDNGNLIPLSQRFNEQNPSILFQTAEPGTEFQTVYHGSPHILRKAGGQVIRGEELGFDHSKMGTGEGAQAFGWGSYVTQVEGIADDYARKLTVAPGTLFVSLEGKKDFIKQRKATLKNLDNGKYEARINKNIKEFTKELKIAQKENNESDIKFYEDLIETSQKDLSEEAKEKYREAFIKDIEKTQEEIKELQAKIKEYKKNIANTYTLNIPADGENYLQWEKEVNSNRRIEIFKKFQNESALEKVLKGELKEEDVGLYLEHYSYIPGKLAEEYKTGESIYKYIANQSNDRNASKFLNSIGFTGISYPANATTGGREDGARNFVIFNEDDISITEWHGKDAQGNILFQNEINDDILNTAAGFDNWVDFMQYMQDVEPDAVPEEAASDWYLNTWEVAHNVSPTSAERKAQVIADREEQNQNEKKDPVFLDGLFAHEIQKEGNLENFLKLVNKITEITDEEINGLEEEERGLVLNELKKIDTVLSHPTIKTARKALLNSDTLKPEHRQRVINLMRGRIRDYRAIYADLTGRIDYAVEQSESMDAELAARARRFDLIKYDSEVENMSPEQKRALEKYVSDKEILKKFREDKVKMDDPDVERYISMLEGQIKSIEKNMAEARREFQDDMERLGNMQDRDIIRQYESFLNLKSEADYKKVGLPAGSKEAMRIGEKAKREHASGMAENYNSLAAKWDTFKKEVEANVRLQERLRAEGKIAELEEKIKYKYDAKRMAMMLSKVEALNAMNKEYGDKRREQVAARELKDLRKNLVKRVMRRVNFSAIDYDQARKIIAIQKVFEPNLRGGINKWIGTENKLAREIWSAWNTDEMAQKNILERLSNKGKTELITLLENTKDIVDFEKWTAKEKKALEKAMPRQDWIKELNLDVWKEERDNALQLPIKEVVRYDTVIEPNGTKRQVPYTGVEITPEIERLLVESIGEDLAYAVNYRHFEDWTTGEMEELARRIKNLFKEGRDKLNAKKTAEKLEADRIRNLIRQTIKDTGIVIEPDDPEDVKKEKQKKIDKILGVQHAFPGTEASKREKSQVQSWLDRILHGYHDANVRRVARILDNYDEGTITNLLYFRENDCFNKKQRAMDKRNEKLDKVIADNKLDMRKLGNVVKFYGQDFTWDEILMFHAAQMNQDDFYAEQLLEDPELEPQYAEKESAYQAIMYGNLIFPEERDAFRKMDEEIREKEQDRLDKLHAAELAGNQEEIDKYKVRDSNAVDENGELLLVGTAKLKSLAEGRFSNIIQNTKDIKDEFKPLIDAIRADYAEEFDNINRVSIEEFNSPVWREKWYLPLVRLTAAGDTHEERVKQDLLGHSAGAGKAATEKGFTKKRVKIGPLNQAPVELGLYKTWADSVDRNEHFVAYAGLVREYNRVFTSRDALGMMQDMENRYGHAMTDYIKTYIKEVANPHVTTPQKGLDKVMHIMRGNTAPAYLGWKFSSILKQGIESPAPFMQFMNPVEYMSAAIKMATDKNVREGIENKSAFMKSRVFDPMVDLINENVEKSMNKPNYLLKKFQQAGMSGLEWIDWACVAPGWLAVYEREYRNLQKDEQALYEQRVAELREQNETRNAKYRMTEEEIHQQASEDVMKDIEEAAVLKADDVVRLCQPSNRDVDLSPMFKNNSEAAKAVLQFQTALNVIWQNIRYDIPYAVRKKEWKQIVGMILGYIMAGVISGVVCSGLLKDDDEPEDTAKRIGFYATTQFLDSMPIVGGNLERLAERAITGEGGVMFGSSLWPTFDKYYNAANAFLKKDYEKALKNVTSGLAISLGLPLSGTKEAAEALGIGDGDGELKLNPEAIIGR